MGIRKGSKHWWIARLVEFFEKRPEVTVRQFASDIGVAYNALHYRLYDRSQRKLREKALQKSSSEMKLVPVDVVGLPTATEAIESSRWLEAETPRGIRLRFAEGTGSEYVADLMSRMAARGI